MITIGYASPCLHDCRTSANFSRSSRVPGSSALLLLDACHAVVPAMGTSSVFPPVARGRVDYSKLKDFVVRPRFLALPRSGGAFWLAAVAAPRSG